MLDSTLLQSLHRTTLKNGIFVLVNENPTADIVAARFFIRSGSQWELPHQAGLEHLISAVITKGTETRSSLDIAEAIESIGASLSADSTTDYFLISCKSVSADFAEVLQLVADLLRAPTFPLHELELERRLTLQAIRSQQEQPFTVAFDQLRKAMYGNHPYAFSGLGTEKSVAQLSQTDLFEFYHTHFRPDNLIVSLSGRIQPDQAIVLLEDVLGDWQIPATPRPHLYLPDVCSKPICSAIAQDTQQSIIMLGYLAPAVINEPPSNSLHPSSATSDYVALKLWNTYLGNGLSSRLFVELREKRGLAYEVSAFYTTRLNPAQFVAYIGTAPDNTTIALDGLHAEVDRLCTSQLSDEEVKAAKNKLLGQYALGKQTNAQIAQTYGWYETLGLGVDFDRTFQTEIATLSPTEIYQVACKYLTQPYVSLVGPASAVDEVANSIG